MESRIAALEICLDTILPTLASKADVESVRGDLHKMDASIRTWMLATMVAIIASMLAALFGLSQLIKGASSQPPQLPAPIIIQAPPPAASVSPMAPTPTAPAQIAPGK